MPRADFQVGDLIDDRYLILAIIGSGGMGTLYRVADRAREDDVVALKTVNLDVPSSEIPAILRRFQREFRILTQLRHLNLVSVHNFGIAPNSVYFTMDFIEGTCLEELRAFTSPHQSIDVIVQICRALAYLHTRGVVHGDLKPSNILLAGEVVKIVDFGVALEARSVRSRAFFYTPGYAAPEMVQLQPVDHRADLYSLGAIWYTLLVGDAPLFDRGSERLIPFMLDEALEAQDEFPMEIAPIITRLMATSPADRYASTNEVIVEINRVLGKSYVLETRETASSYALRGRFVGREQEMALLQARWEQALTGMGQMVLVGGESGVGKTRLMEEFAVQAELGGARSTRGQCVETGGSAYHPWREVLSVLVHHVERSETGTIQRVGPVLASLLPELWQRPYMASAAPPPPLEPRAAQQRLNDGIVHLLRAAARTRPLVITIEDAHWADEATLELLELLTRIPWRARLLLGVTYRRNGLEPAHPLSTLQGENVTRIHLQNLPAGVTTELVSSMLGQEQVPQQLLEQVQDTTHGNAFFVQELIRSLAESESVLQRTVSGWEIDSTALRQTQLPQSIRQVVRQRIERLPTPAHQTLEWAAVMGHIFWEGALVHIGGRTRTEILAGLNVGLEREFVRLQDISTILNEREYMFSESAVRQVSYENVPPGERQAYHRQAAEWLIAHVGDRDDLHLGLIADHLEQAGESERAIPYLRRAGEQAAEQFAGSQALEYFERGLALVPESDLAERYALHLGRVRMHHLRGERDAEEEDLEAIERLAKQLDDDRRRAEAAMHRANYTYLIADYETTTDVVQQLIALGQAIGETYYEAHGYIEWGSTLWSMGEYEESQEKVEQGLQLAEEHPALQARGLRILSLLYRYRDDFLKAREYGEQSLRICREIGDRRAEALTLNNLGGINHDQLSSYDRAKVCFEQAREIFCDIGDSRHEGHVLENLALISDWLGDYEQARQYHEQALERITKVKDLRVKVILLANFGLLFHHLGEDETALEYNQRAIDLAQEIGEPSGEAFAQTNLGHSLLALGRAEEARAAYQHALTQREELGQLQLAQETRAGLARVCLAQGELAQAGEHAEEIWEYLHYNTLDGVDEPLRAHLTCYRVMEANRDPRAQSVLEMAYEVLHEKASRIGDERLRRSFLENVAVHRTILEIFGATRSH
jgi:predicted ATPase